jgi:hypothetical protein
MEAAIERARVGKPVDPNVMPPARFSFEGLVVNDDWPNFQIETSLLSRGFSGFLHNGLLAL